MQTMKRIAIAALMISLAAASTAGEQSPLPKDCWHTSDGTVHCLAAIPQAAHMEESTDEYSVEFKGNVFVAVPRENLLVIQCPIGKPIRDCRPCNPWTDPMCPLPDDKDAKD